MSFVDVTVRVNMEDHTFVQTPEQAQAMVENILRRDPNWSTHDMSVVKVKGNVTSTQKRETSEDGNHNVFRDRHTGAPNVGM